MSVEILVRDRGDRDDGWRVTLRDASGVREYEMHAYVDEGGRRWPLAETGGVVTSKLMALAARVAARTATAEEAAAYGRHLHTALFARGSPSMPAGTDPLPVTLRWRTDDSDLHQLVWELLHDGDGYVALRQVQPWVLTRVPVDDGAPLPTVERPPRVLFAVGSRLADPRVRAGAEVMGVLRAIQARGYAASARVLTEATVQELSSTRDRMRPDIVHLIAHGRRLPSGGVRVELRAEADGSDDPVGPTELAEALRDTAMVVLSACDAGVATPDLGAPMAARMVQAGLPLVVAMAGEISDTSCRMFTRALVASVATDLPLMHAIALGRRIAFVDATDGPATVDWALPALFAARPVPADHRVADTARQRAVRSCLRDQDEVEEPVFVARGAVLAAVDHLLNPEVNPAALVLHASGSRLGGTRALKEIAVEAVARGHAAVRIGPFLDPGDEQVPTSLPQVFHAIGQRIAWLADVHDVAAPTRLLATLAGTDVDDHDPWDARALQPRDVLDRPAAQMGRALRNDLLTLQTRLAAAKPAVFRSDAAPVVLLDDIDLYEGGLEPLLEHMGAKGLVRQHPPIPVAAFGRTDRASGAAIVQRAEVAPLGGVRAFLELSSLHCGTVDRELLYAPLLAWLLHPPSGAAELRSHAPTQVGTDAEGAWLEMWHDLLEGQPFYDQQIHRHVLKWCRLAGWLTDSDDTRYLAHLGET